MIPLPDTRRFTDGPIALPDHPSEHRDHDNDNFLWAKHALKSAAIFLFFASVTITLSIILTPSIPTLFPSSVVPPIILPVTYALAVVSTVAYLFRLGQFYWHINRATIPHR